MDKLVLEYSPLLIGEYWQLTVNQSDPVLVEMYNRHYSARQYKDGRIRNKVFLPGHSLGLMTLERNAFFIWNKQKFRYDKQPGIYCQGFRNESGYLSSLLILEAVDLAIRRWGKQRMFTFINPLEVKSRNPGYCFKRAGWRGCGESKGGLLILEFYPT